MTYIFVKQNRRNNWWCYGTINGYDKSFEGNTQNAVKQKMIQYLKKQKVDMEQVKWFEPNYYQHDKNIPEDGMRRIKSFKPMNLDNL